MWILDKQWLFSLVLGKESTCQFRMWVQSLGWEDPLEQGMATYSSILAWRIPMDRGTSWTTVHGVPKIRMQLSMAQHKYCMYMSNSTGNPVFLCVNSGIPAHGRMRTLCGTKERVGMRVACLSGNSLETSRKLVWDTCVWYRKSSEWLELSHWRVFEKQAITENPSEYWCDRMAFKICLLSYGVQHNGQFLFSCVNVCVLGIEPGWQVSANASWVSVFC